MYFVVADPTQNYTEGHKLIVDCFPFFSTVFIVFIACMHASVCMIVCQLLTNKDSYINFTMKGLLSCAD